MREGFETHSQNQKPHEVSKPELQASVLRGVQGLLINIATINSSFTSEDLTNLATRLGKFADRLEESKKPLSEIEYPVRGNRIVKATQIPMQNLGDPPPSS